MHPKAWDDYKQRTKRWAIRIEHELIHSDAFLSLRYAPAIKVLVWGFEKRKIEKTNRRGKNRFLIKDEPFPFTYEEARRRRLTDKQFHRAIKELIEKGFWDLEKSGSGLKGDYSTYRFSNRWRSFGKADFQFKSIPPRVLFGCFGKPQKSQNQPEKSAVGQREKIAVEDSLQWEKTAVGKPAF